MPLRFQIARGANYQADLNYLLALDLVSVRQSSLGRRCGLVSLGSLARRAIPYGKATLLNRVKRNEDGLENAY